MSKFFADRVRFLITGTLTILVCASSGCTRQPSQVQEIQRKRDEQQRESTEIDQLNEAFGFIQKIAELDPAAARQRVTSLLNGWIDQNPWSGDWNRPELLKSLEPLEAGYPVLETLDQPRFLPSDVEYLKLSYALKQIDLWVAPESSLDPLFADWIESQEVPLGAEGKATLKRALQLFDWTIRNIQLEPNVFNEPVPPSPPMPPGIEFLGPGYRQTVFQTLNRGVGDSLQRARVFLQLCRASSIDACMLGLLDNQNKATPWTTGVLIGNEIFLFETMLGIPVPGPEEKGIATLAEAREDESILRRLNVIGFFDYPITSSMVGQTVALLDAPVESMARRMLHLQQALVGKSRMKLAYDVDAVGKRLDAVDGVAGARLWSVDIQSRLHEQIMAQIVRDNVQIAVWEYSKSGMLNGTFPLALARWKHLKGAFEKEELEPGARLMYMKLRHPEFEIDELRNNVDLQLEYGLRRSLGVKPEEYDFQIRQIQQAMRQAKRTATYWISLIHYDRGDFENARNWYEKRVLDEDRLSPWKPAARYNLGRTLERLSQPEQAIELYKTIGDPQEHGNRIRARLLSARFS